LKLPAASPPWRTFGGNALAVSVQQISFLLIIPSLNNLNHRIFPPSNYAVVKHSVLWILSDAPTIFPIYPEPDRCNASIFLFKQLENIKPFLLKENVDKK